MLRQRLLTAGVLLPLVVWGVLALPTFYFSLVIIVIVLLAAGEWAALIGWSALPLRLMYCLIVAAAIAALVFFAASLDGMYNITGVAMLWWLAATVWLVRLEMRGEQIAVVSVTNAIQKISAASIGLLVLVPAWFALISLHQSVEYGPHYVLFVMMLVWIADSGAYFAGRRWGRTRLAPHISPGKTWEGVIGALVFSLVAAVAAALILQVRSKLAFVLVCMITVIFSISGDLLKSVFKRRAGVKDSGKLLPGHGGVLDRIDSLTAASPAFLLGLLVLERWQ